tara:strand:+ start:240 stop:668 length:429 start_codon:yes stop_codon:yes gene_type:complete
MKLKFKKLHPSAVIPTKGTDAAAAYDLVSIERVFIPCGETVVVSTGLAMEIPIGWRGDIYSRSGLASNGVVVANSPGKIDSDYRGEIKVLLHNNRATNIVGIEAGDRIAQFEVAPVYDLEFEEVTELEPSERGEKGLGSTGK